MYKLIAFDLDFTLLTSEHRISERNKQALIELSKHATVVFASGRPISSMLPFVKQLPKGTIPYLLGSNGAHCTGPTGEIFYEAFIEGEMLLPLYHEAIRRDVSFHYYLGGYIYANKDSIVVRKDGEFMEMPVKIVGDFDERLPKMRLHKFHSMGDPIKLGGYYEWLKEQDLPLHPILSKPHILEVPPKGVDKGVSLRMLARHLGLTRRNVIAVGDSFNDVGMLKYAGLGLAMRNAAKGVKDAANRTLYVHHDQDMVEVILEIVKNPRMKRQLSYKEPLL